MLNILVCLKQVAYLPSRMAIGPDGKIDKDGVVYVPNPYDELALEEALRVKEQKKQAEVILISVGPPRVENVLRYGMAMGADWSIHVCDDELENMNYTFTSNCLMKVIKDRRFDMIFFGIKATDTNNGIVGCRIAELLNLTYVSSVTEVRALENKNLGMFKILDRGNRQALECEPPVVLSIGRGTVKPRYPTLKERRLSLAKKIVKITPSELGIESSLTAETVNKIPKISLLRPTPKKIFTPDSELTAIERLKLTISGGLVEKRTNSFDGSPQETAEQFINFIEENSII